MTLSLWLDILTNFVPFIDEEAHDIVVSSDSSMTWSTCHSHQNLLLLASWQCSWMSRCIKKTRQPGRTEGCTGGTGSGHSRQTQEVKNFIPCLSISTSSSRQCDLPTSNFELIFVALMPSHVSFWALHY